MVSLRLHVDPTPSVVEPIAEGLRRFNEERVGPYRSEQLAVLASGEKGEGVGGIQGVLLWGWLYIERLWVSNAHRREGIGGALLERLESEAMTRGARRMVVLTTSWQAPEFYLRRGYREIVAFELDIPAGRESAAAQDHLLVKSLEP